MTAVRDDADGKPAWYDEQGRSLKRQFLKSPLPFEPRITSGFSSARLHPVYGDVRPHLGVDYGAPAGTAVMAVAAGVVESADWAGEAGRMVMMRHTGGYETLYLHLSAFASGASRRRARRAGALIGRVGMTGAATGPHLDYRIKKNGMYVNPIVELSRMPAGRSDCSGRAAAFRETRAIALLPGFADSVWRRATAEPRPRKPQPPSKENNRRWPSSLSVSRPSAGARRRRHESLPFLTTSSTPTEARALAATDPLSFLHVTRAEVDLPPATNPYDARVYAQAVANFEALKRDAPLVLDDEPSLYLYRLRMGSHEQIGLAGCFSVDEYDRDLIKKHERTRKDKEDDRTRHMMELRAQTGVVFLTYKATRGVEAIVPARVRPARRSTISRRRRRRPHGLARHGRRTSRRS